MLQAGQLVPPVKPKSKILFHLAQTERFSHSGYEKRGKEKERDRERERDFVCVFIVGFSLVIESGAVFFFACTQSCSRTYIILQ